MRATGTPIENSVRGRMQLRYTRQGTTGNSSGVPGKETIHETKSEPGMGPHRLQELSNLHDDERTKRTTTTMDVRIKSIQVQNRIPSRERRRKTRRPYEKSGGPTHGRRQKTHTKCGDLVAKRTILRYPRDGRNQTRRTGNNRIPRQG